MMIWTRTTIIFGLLVPGIVMGLGSLGFGQEEGVPTQISKQWPSFSEQDIRTVQVTYNVKLSVEGIKQKNVDPLHETKVSFYWKTPDQLRIRYEWDQKIKGGPGRAIQGGNNVLKRFLKDRIRFLSEFIIQYPLHTTKNRYVNVKDQDKNDEILIDLMKGRQLITFLFSSDGALQSIKKKTNTFAGQSVPMIMQVERTQKSGKSYVRKLVGNQSFSPEEGEEGNAGFLRQKMKLTYSKKGGEDKKTQIPERIEGRFSGKEGEREYRVEMTLALADFTLNEKLPENAFE